MAQNGSRVYVIEGAGLVKIGISLSVAARLKQLQPMCPVPLSLVTSGPGGRKEEMALHERYSEQRVHGEWFNLTETQLAELVRLVETGHSKPTKGNKTKPLHGPKSATRIGVRSELLKQVMPPVRPGEIRQSTSGRRPTKHG